MEGLPAVLLADLTPIRMMRVRRGVLESVNRREDPGNGGRKKVDRWRRND
jgi:hypothetical protein